MPEWRIITLLLNEQRRDACLRCGGQRCRQPFRPGPELFVTGPAVAVTGPAVAVTGPAVAVTGPAVAVTDQQIPYSQGQPLNGQDEEERTFHPLVLLTQTAEAALARAEVLSELSRLFTQLKQSSVHIKDALFVVDLHGLCIYMSPAAEVFCGIHRGTVSESTLEDIFTELLPRIRNADEVHAYLHDFILGNVYRQDLHCVLAVEPVHAAQSPDVGAGSLAEPRLEDRYTLSGGQLPRRASRSSLLMDSVPSDQHYRLTRYPLLNQQGTLIANVLQVQDITAQVRDEKNKSALLSSVSHDLRTPLTTIKAAVTGLLQADVEWDEEIRREILEEIDAEADHLGVLVNALIEMSRIEMGALVLDKEWCDIVEVVHGVLLRLERALAGRPIRTQFQAQLPLIYADHVQVERVFYNLIEHALRHSSGNAEMLVAVDTVDVWAGGQVDALPGGEVAGTQEGALTVTRPADAPDVPLRYLRVKIIDYGCELSADERERVFRTFYGLNAHGSGLGLAISRGIVEAHQGQIGVEAAPDGDGLCFVFTLPLLGSQFIASTTEESSTDIRS